MRSVFLVCFILTAVDVFALESSKRWFHNVNLDGFKSLTGTPYTTRNVVSCGLRCSGTSDCLSFFFTSGQPADNCQLNSQIYMDPTNPELMPEPNTKYYINYDGLNISSSNISMPQLQCHPDDGAYRTVELNDTSTFTYVVISTEYSYNDAMIICNENNGTLVKINTSAKMQMVQAILSCPAFNVVGLSPFAYVDGVFNGINWVYNDGTIATFPTTFWSSQPVNILAGSCVNLDRMTGWFAESTKCIFIKMFICEK